MSVTYIQPKQVNIAIRDHEAIPNSLSEGCHRKIRIRTFAWASLTLNSEMLLYNASSKTTQSEEHP
jgi:hypothetical protein